MNFVWYDYNPETMGVVENWLDEHAVRMTGMDDGFRQEYEYWSNEDYNIVGENYWCKVVFENEVPFAVIEFGLYEGVVTIMETLVAPEKRGQGMGSKLIKELLANSKTIISIDIEKAEAIIFPSNIASQKAFEKAGFKYHHTHEDGDAMTYVYEVNPIAKHYDILISEGNDPVHDPEPLKAYMDKWDGQVFIDKMQLSKDNTVLEIGVGTGRLAVRTAPLCKEFHGIDISPETTKGATKNLEEYQNVNLICDDFTTHSFNTTFDVIYSSLTFMHIKDKQSAINKVQQLLKNGGLFVLSTDKNQDKFIDIGTNKIEVYPDTPEEILQCINNSEMKLLEHYETEFANVFVCKKELDYNSGFMINFEYLNKADFSVYAQTIFDILSDNMTKIAPTGNTLEEDFRMWFSAVSSGLQRDERQIILIKDSENVVGFFQYYTNKDTFMMEEIQFKPEYQGKGIFRELYGFVIETIRNDLRFVEAYANICNKKSIGILGKLGLDNIGLNKNGHSYHFKGEFDSLVEWYEKK